jgi:hypothetical protein
MALNKFGAFSSTKNSNAKVGAGLKSDEIYKETFICTNIFNISNTNNLVSVAVDIANN